jgi:aryl-alcohol dehydrogenase-like predicted oxidoreductase
MQYVYKNDLKISKMTLGTAQLGINYGVNNSLGVPSRHKSHEILDVALQGGVNVFDTAPAYGNSEEVIGDFLKKCEKQKTMVCTKASVGNVDSNKVFEALKFTVDRSLKRLCINQLPFLLLHNEFDFLQYGSVLTSALKELKAQGAVLNAGISLSDKSYLDMVLDCGVFSAVQIPINLWDNGEIKNQMIEKLKKAGILVFARSIFLQGLFFRDTALLEGTVLQEASEFIWSTKRIAEEEGISVLEMALAFVRDQSGVSSLVIGSETPSQVNENIRMFDAPPLSKKTHDKILDCFDNVPSILIKPWEWTKRSLEQCLT